MQELLINHLLDIIIAVVLLVVILSSFFKPTYRYVRHLVGLLVSFIAMFALKAVDLFNIVEVFLRNLFDRFNFKGYVEIALNFFGKGNLAAEKVDTVYSLTILLIFGLVVFLLVNLIMGLSHAAKVKAENRRGNYVYNNPFGSFLLSVVLSIICLTVVTAAFATLPFETDYLGNSYILTFVNNLLNMGYNAIKNFIPLFKDFASYSDVIKAIIA